MVILCCRGIPCDKKLTRQTTMFTVHRKMVLTEAQAIAIYEQKPMVANEKVVNLEVGTATKQSRRIAEQYGVSPKAVRDIWNGKTWTFATQHWILANKGSILVADLTRDAESRKVRFYGSNFDFTPLSPV